MIPDYTESLYAIDLSERQTLRTLEQAIRHRAEVTLHPRTCAHDVSIVCRLAPADVHALLEERKQLLLTPVNLDVDESPERSRPDDPHDNPEDLIGVYADVSIRLGEHRYLFSSSITGIDRKVGEPAVWSIRVTRPEKLQVAQRRRFRRFQTVRSTRVQLAWTQDDQGDGEGTGWLCNLSTDGLACRVDGSVSDRLWIGTPLKLQFSLAPSDARLFILDGVLCNKTPAGSTDKCILGVQFLTGEGHEVSSRSATALRDHLLPCPAITRYAREGVDT